jgi:hypothetical protein
MNQCRSSDERVGHLEVRVCSPEQTSLICDTSIDDNLFHPSEKPSDVALVFAGTCQ